LSCLPVVLRKRADFLAAAASGQKCGTKGVVLQLRLRSDDGVGYGLTASKRVGNAVCRNRAKRRLRALVQDTLAQHAKFGHDYVLIARTETITRDYALLRGDLLYALKKLGALRPQTFTTAVVIPE
jgi:ribonuclease P protein component